MCAKLLVGAGIILSEDKLLPLKSSKKVLDGHTKPCNTKQSMMTWCGVYVYVYNPRETE